MGNVKAVPIIIISKHSVKNQLKIHSYGALILKTKAHTQSVNASKLKVNLYGKNWGILPLKNTKEQQGLGNKYTLELDKEQIEMILNAVKVQYNLLNDSPNGYQDLIKKYAWLYWKIKKVNNEDKQEETVSNGPHYLS